MLKAPWSPPRLSEPGSKLTTTNENPASLQAVPESHFRIAAKGFAANHSLVIRGIDGGECAVPAQRILPCAVLVAVLVLAEPLPWVPPSIISALPGSTEIETN